MNVETYAIPQLLADLRRIRAQCTDERQILHAVRQLARRAALSKAAWLEKRMYEADEKQGCGVYLLHEEPDHGLAVLALAWLPDRGTAPHDHGTWATRSSSIATPSIRMIPARWRSGRSTARTARRTSR